MVGTNPVDVPVLSCALCFSNSASILSVKLARWPVNSTILALSRLENRSIRPYERCFFGVR